MKRKDDTAVWRAKKLKKIAAILCALVIFTTAATLMYMSYLTNSVNNTFKLGNAEVSVVEPGIDQGNVEWGETSKPVYLENPQSDTSIPGVVRAMLVPVLKDGQTGETIGGELNIMTEPVNDQMALGDITLHFADDWETNWFYRDGYFYYRQVLDPGERSAQLLSGVTLTNGSLSNANGNVQVTIEVLADILQSEGNAAQNEWNVSVSESGIVTPN